MVAGKRPNSTLDKGSLFSVEYLTTDPFGFPWASVKYQYLPLGSIAIPCGPSFSVGIIPTDTLSVSTISLPSNFSTETRSSDSAAT